MGADTGNAKGGVSRQVDPFITIAEKLKREIDELFKNGIEKISSLPAKNAFTKEEEALKAMWKNEMHKVTELFSEIVTEGDNNNDKVTMICKLMDMKDNILNQIFSGMLYRKIVTFIDLNIVSEKYEAERVVQLYNLVNQFKSEKDFIPTKLAFEPLEEDFTGFYSQNELNVASETS